jgi:hypothetical protein
VKSFWKQFPSPAEFAARSTIAFDSTSGNSLQSVIDSSPPYSIIELPTKDIITGNILISRPIWLKGNSATIFGTGCQDALVVASEHAVISDLQVDLADSTNGGGICVKSGYAKFIKCEVRAISLSAFQVAGTAAVDIDGCDIGCSHNAPLLVREDAIVRITSSSVHGGKGYGILLDNNATAYVKSTTISENGMTGLTVQGNSSLNMSQCDVFGNGSCGIDVQSTGSVKIDGTVIRDHSHGTGLSVLRGAGAAFLNSRITNCSACLAKVSDGAGLRCAGSQFEGQLENVLVMVTSGGFFVSEGDKFQGRALSAVAVCDGARAQIHSLQLQSFDGVGLMAYDGGFLGLTQCAILQSTKIALHVRDQATVEFDGVTIAGCPAPAMTITRGVTGTIKNSRFVQNAVGAEFSFCGRLEVTACEFSQNAQNGAMMQEAFDAKFTSCAFRDNQEFGVDCVRKGCSPYFEACEWARNGRGGINVEDGAFADFKSCTILENRGIGLGVQGATARVIQVDLTQNNEASISVSERSTAQFESCTIHDNPGFGAQVYLDSKAKFAQCHFSQHPNSPALFVTNGAKARCRLCRFQNQVAAHCDVSQSATISLVECDLSLAARGTGVQVNLKGKLKLKGTHIHQESKYGIVIADEGSVIGTKASIYGCGTAGVFMVGSASASFTDSYITGNGDMGVHVQGGELTLKGCVLKQHRQYGVLLSVSGKFTDGGNEFRENMIEDIGRPA